MKKLVLLCMLICTSVNLCAFQMGKEQLYGTFPNLRAYNCWGGFEVA